jgi:hypothetical protein
VQSLRWPVAVLLVAALAAAVPSQAAEATVFGAVATPSEAWKAGVGAALGIGLLELVTLEAEAARLPAETPESRCLTFTGSALLTPPLGKLTPYAGLGIGVFRQSDQDAGDWGTLRALILGLKLRPAPLLVLKGEYRRISLSGEPFFPLEHRYSFGAGLSF